MKVAFLAGHEFNGNNLNGGKQGSRKLYDLWAEAVGKENVYVLMPSNYEYETDMPNIYYFRTHHNRLEQMKNACLMRNGYDSKAQKQIVEYVEKINPDIVYFDHSNIGLLLKGMKLPSSTKVMVFMHNIEHDYVWNKVRYESKLFYIPYLSYSKNEKYIVQNADVVMNLNERDANRLEELYSRKCDYLIPVSYDDVFDERKLKVDKEGLTLELLFVGAYVGPNINGICWFIENVLPLVPNCRLTIAGLNMEKMREKYQEKNINIVGTVDDLGDYYYLADAVIIPILYGAGMKTKTAEAMMYGKKIIATDEALEGYLVDGISDIVRANSEQEFVKGIEKIRGTGSYSQKVRELFLEKYSTKKIKKDFCEFIGNMFK